MRFASRLNRSFATQSHRQPTWWRLSRCSAQGDIRQIEPATGPASMAEPTQRFKGFSLLLDALAA